MLQDYGRVAPDHDQPGGQTRTLDPPPPAGMPRPDRLHGGRPSYGTRDGTLPAHVNGIQVYDKAAAKLAHGFFTLSSATFGHKGGEINVDLLNPYKTTCRALGLLVRAVTQLDDSDANDLFRSGLLEFVAEVLIAYDGVADTTDVESHFMKAAALSIGSLGPPSSEPSLRRWGASTRCGQG